MVKIPDFRGASRIIHLYLGLVSGAVILILCVTGAVYSLEPVIRGYLYRNIAQSNNAKLEAKPLHVQIDTIQKSFPESKIKSFVLHGNKDLHSEVLFYKGKPVFLNPCTLEIHDASAKAHDLFYKVLRIHKNLYLGKAGSWIIRLSTLVFLIMLVSGIILWWPSGTRNLRHKFVIQLKGRQMMKLYSFHSVAGFYTSWFLLTCVLTGLIWSFNWFDTLVKTGLKPSINTIAYKSNSSDSLKSNDPLRTVEQFMAERYTHFETMVFRLPRKQGGALKVVVELPEPGLFKGKDLFAFSAESGTIISERRFQTASLGYKVLSSQKEIHTFKIFGIAGPYLGFLICLAGAGLPITGFWMWLEKKRQSARKKPVRSA